jgi:hypothetical protein
VNTLVLVPTALLLALTACSVAEAPPAPSEIAINACDGNEDCPGGSCADGACVANASGLRSVIVEVTPPPGSAIAPLAYYTRLGEKLGDDIVIQPAAAIEGYVSLHPDGCTPSFVGVDAAHPVVPVEGTIPVKATFTGSTREYGLPPRSYESEPLTDPERDREKNGFKVLVPPGDYDVYIEPFEIRPDSDCRIPPVLLRRQRVTGSGLFDVKLSLPSSITISVHWPTASLDFFSVDLLDSVSGRVLSTPARLGNPGLDAEKRAFYQATVSYSRVLEPNAMGELVVSPTSYELVRISPPAGTVAASILGDASAIGLSGTNQGGIALSAPLPAPVKVEMQTAVGDTTKPVPAAITVTATRLEGMTDGLYGTFIQTYQVNAEGLVDDAFLPPGDYIVDSVPNGGSASCGEDTCSVLAARRDYWQIGATPSVQAGKLIQFQPAPVVSGSAFSAVGKPVSGALVRARASHSTPSSDVWNRLDREGALLATATTSLVDVHGNFEFSADPGTFDLFVQPDPSTRFGWYVRPSFVVGAEDTELPLGTLTVPLSRRYAGTILVGPKTTDRPVLPNALIRAYVYVTPDGEYAAAPVADGSVIQVAETRSNDAGEFELLIPASLDSPSRIAD